MAAYIGEFKNVYKYFLKMLYGKHHLGHLGVFGKTILKYFARVRIISRLL
jgi:hypothetical protein